MSVEAEPPVWPTVNSNVPVDSIDKVFEVPVMAPVVPATIPCEYDDVPPFATIVTVAAETVALADGTAATDSNPAPRADTATSAMRLRSVFVDIIFLSLVRSRLS